MPIYELLGGAVRETIPLYTHFQYSTNVEQMVENAVGEVGQRLAGDQDRPVHGGRRVEQRHATSTARSTATVENTGVAMIAGIREAVGPDIEVLIDAHALYNVPTAIRLANRLAPYDITWFEEPCPPESYDALEQVRAQVPTRISVGDELVRRLRGLALRQPRLFRWDVVGETNAGSRDRCAAPDPT